MKYDNGVPAIPEPTHVRTAPYAPLSAGTRPSWTEAESEPGGWQRHWHVFSRHKLSIILLAAVGLAGGFAVFVPRSPVYSAQTTLELQPINENFMNIGSVDPLSGAISDASLNAQTQISIIRSNSVVGPAIDRMERESSSVVAAPTDTFSKVRSHLGIVPKEPVQAFKDGLTAAVKSLSVRLVPGTRIIEIQSESTVPEVAANFVNAVASEYQYQNAQYRSTNAQRTSQWLQGQVEETKSRLDQAEAKLQEFVRKSGNVFASESETLSSSKLRELQASLAAAQGERIAKQTVYEASLTRPVESFPPEFNSRLMEYNTEITKLQQQAAQLTTKFTTNHPKVQEVQAQIAQLTEARDREQKNILARIKGDYDAAVTHEKLLQSAYTAAAGAVTSEADKAAEYGSLKREAEILRNYLNALLAQNNQASVASAIPVTSSRSIDLAKPATEPNGPSLPRHLATGFGAGGMLGYLIALLKDTRRQKRQRDRFGLPGYATQLLNVPELGVIPSAALENGKPVWGLLSRKAGAEKRATAGEAIEGGAGSVELVTWKSKPSLLAESFRLTLASLTVRSKNGAAPSIIVVTSPSPAEGKTTVATNIAIARAETNRKVLLLETDLRKPRLANIFGLSDPHGWK